MNSQTIGRNQKSRELPLKWGALLFVIGGGLQACAQTDVLAFEYEVYEVENGVAKLFTSRCIELPPGSVSGVGHGAAPGGAPVLYKASYEFSADSVTFSAGPTENSTLVTKTYDEEFLRSGETDTVQIELSDDFALLVNNRSVVSPELSSVQGCDLSPYSRYR